MVMAIGVKADHIFQGIIYGKPRHPLLRQAIQHAFGRQVFAAKANLDYMIYCKFQNPRVGWNISPTYGPSYLFQERHDRKKSKIYDNEGHHFVTVQGMTVAFTRCWKWQKGFQGDPSTKERTDKMLQANVAAITLEVSERDTSGMEHSSQRQGAQPAATSTARGQPDAPKPEDITTFVSEGIRDNTSHHGACRGLELPQRLDGAGCA